MSSLLTNTFIIHLDVSRTLRGEYGGRSSRLDQEDPTSSVMHVGAPIMNDGEIVGVLAVYKPQRSMLLFIIETKQRLQNLVDQLGTCGKESPMSLGFLRCFLFETGFAASIGIARMHRSQRKVLAGADRPLPFEFAMAGEVMCLG